jgi:peptidoglycan/xylan/chitin deacetylase (PgdA/CDA1 family)
MPPSPRRIAARVARSLSAAGGLRALAALRGWRGLVLCYHTLGRDELAEQLDHFARFADFVDLDTLLARSGEPSRGGRLPVSLTFDDGKRSHLTELSGLLEERGVPASFYVTVDASRDGGLAWFDLSRRVAGELKQRGALQGAEGAVAELVATLRRLAQREGRPASEVANLRVVKWIPASERDELLARAVETLRLDTQPATDHERCLSPEEVGLLARRGFTIGSHTCSHPMLTREEPERVRRELGESQRALSEWIGAPVRHFAYPNGNSSAATERLTREAGYQSACTTRPMFVRAGENPHRLPRIQLVPEYDESEIALKVLLGALVVLPNPDGTGWAYRREPSHVPTA